MTEQIKDWIIHWFEKRNPGIDIDASRDYYEMRLLDSFGIIELIDVLEEHFAIVFSDEDFRQAEFRTIQGLSSIIAAKQPG